MKRITVKEYRASHKRSESEHQIEVFRVLALNETKYPFLRWIHASMNGASASSAAAAGQRKRQGQKKGIFDICVPIGNLDFTWLWIELKVKPNKLTPEQIEFQQFVELNGGKASVAWSDEEVLEIIEDYLRIQLKR